MVNGQQPMVASLLALDFDIDAQVSRARPIPANQIQVSGPHGSYVSTGSTYTPNNKSREIPSSGKFAT
jgi:hypothetical protein